MKKLENKIEKKIEKKMTAKSFRLPKARDVKAFANDALNYASSTARNPLVRAGLKYLTGIDLQSGFDQSDTTAVTQNTVRRNYYSISTAPRWKGFQGVRITGSQIISNVSATNASDSLINLALSPDIIGGSMALDARNYNRYTFREFVLEYVPNITYTGPATATNALLFALGYSADSEIGTHLTLGYTQVSQMKDSIQCNTFRRCLLPVRPLIDNLYYTEVDAASVSGLRLTEQGRIAMFLIATANANQSAIGALHIHYVLDLYDRSPDYGFTMQLDLPEKDRIDLLKILVDKYGEKVSRRDRNYLLRCLTPTKTDPDLVVLQRLIHPEKNSVVNPDYDWDEVKEQPPEKACLPSKKKS
jgi:hypothetical protein